jgi:hypothetical protein
MPTGDAKQDEVNEEGAGFGVPLVALVAASTSTEADCTDFTPLSATLLT